MWHSQSIISLKATKTILEYTCIFPFQENWTQCIYNISIFLLYEILFFGTFYLSMVSTGDIYTHANNYDTLYIVHQIAEFSMGPCFGLGIILSLCSRSDQLKLQKRMATLDIKLKSHLGVEPSFRRLNIEFIMCLTVVTMFYCVDYFYFVFSLTIVNHIFFLCCITSAIYFYWYGFYIVYWARAYIHRSDYIIDALKTATSQKCISKPTLSMILELINLLFEVHESIQDAFGSILFMIILVITIGSAESSFGVVHVFERHPEQIDIFLDWVTWFIILWLELTIIFASFNRIGNVVSEYASLRKRPR